MFPHPKKKKKGNKNDCGLPCHQVPVQCLVCLHCLLDVPPLVLVLIPPKTLQWCPLQPSFWFVLEDDLCVHTQATSADILQTSISISGVSHSLDANFVAGFGFVSLVSLNYFEKEKKKGELRSRKEKERSSNRSALGNPRC